MAKTKSWTHLVEKYRGQWVALAEDKTTVIPAGAAKNEPPEGHLKNASYERRSPNSSSTAVVYAALIADILVAISKVGAAIWTGSAAMTSEAIHSIVDTTNEILLLYGIHRSRQKADTDHPFGYGRELYFWSFVVSLLIFALGAGFSIYQGIYRILYPVPIQLPIVSYVVLALAFLFEGGSWLYSLRQFRRAKGDLGFFRAFRLSKDPPSFMTLFEDSVALLGILIAAAATFAAVALGRPEFDGIGSIAIGLILAATSVFLARESKSLLIGEQAYPSIRNSILSLANAQPSCLSANGLFTVQLGPDQVIAMLSLEFSDVMLAPQIEEAVINLEKKVREENPEIVALFVKLRPQKRFKTSVSALLVKRRPNKLDRYRLTRKLVAFRSRSFSTTAGSLMSQTP